MRWGNVSWRGKRGWIGRRRSRRRGSAWIRLWGSGETPVVVRTGLASAMLVGEGARVVAAEASGLEVRLAECDAGGRWTVVDLLGTKDIGDGAHCCTLRNTTDNGSPSSSSWSDIKVSEASSSRL